MPNLTKADVQRMKDLLKYAILNKKPADYVGKSHDGDWFAISAGGKISYNWRNREYSLDCVIKVDAPDLYTRIDFYSDGATIVDVINSVLNSAAVRTYRQQFVDANVTDVRKSITDQLETIKQNIANLERQRDELNAKLESLD